MAAVPAFSSLPGADHTIYLDFDGHVTTGTTWNSQYGVNTINSPAYDTDGNPSTFSATELSVIENAWKWVAEDFAPFEVNVTTVDPGAAALSYSGGGDTQWGTRVVITDDTFANCGCGGHAFLGSFDDSQDEPVFVYNTSMKGVSEASSHEVGHALFLRHDGYSGGAYYWGHGSGSTSWAPLMGASYNRSVTQWSKGEYYDSNESEDDLAIISSLTNGNGFGYRADDHGDTDAAATLLATTGGSISASGIIETMSDVDVLSFNTGTGSVSINIDPAAVGPNLDILAKLYDSSGTLVATSNPSNVLNASFNLNLAADQYYIHVDGTGTGNPFSSSPTGYTEYGSLGNYSVSGTVVDPGGLPGITIDDVTVDEGDGTATFTVTLSGTVNDPVSVDFSTSNGTATAGSDYTATNGSLAFAAAGSQDITVSIIDDAVATEGSETIYVNLSNASNATIIDGQGTATIHDNDTGISIGDTSGNEGNLGKGKNKGNPTFKDFNFAISLSNPVSHPVTVNYSTQDGSATTADSDYQSASGVVTFDPGETSQTILVTVVGDETQEPDETFTVVLSGPIGGNIADGTGVGTIQDDDSGGGGKGGGGNGGGGGGGNCNGNNPNCGDSDVEMRDPHWWFDGPSHDHDQHEHETGDLHFTLVPPHGTTPTKADSNSYSVQRLLEPDDASSKVDWTDRAMIDLEYVVVTAGVESLLGRRAYPSASDSDERSPQDMPIDNVFGEFADEPA